MRQVIGLVVLLAAFWLALSGHYTPLLLAMGAASVALVAVLARRMQLLDAEGEPLQYLPRVLPYWAWLSGQILVSAWDVTRRIWSPRARVAPVMRSTAAAGFSDVCSVTYANSITLTPGTLSVAVRDGSIEVHALDETLIADLDRGSMRERVRLLEPRR